MKITISISDDIIEELQIYEIQSGLSKEDITKMALTSFIKSDTLKLIKSYRENIIEEKLFKAREAELDKRLRSLDKDKNNTNISKPKISSDRPNLITPKELPEDFPLDSLLDANSVQDLNPK